MEKGLRFSFDKEADILDISIGKPKKAISREVKDDFFVRIDPKTRKVVGFSILNFEKWFKSEKDEKLVPIRAEFLLG
ncbi:DUF2283 domain-containing protein [Candidatus Woesearchaeota archaeon]|nr:DUF2283 domain-containing protein [Candidatus Woesearchaeota archaeon]